MSEDLAYSHFPPVFSPISNYLFEREIGRYQVACYPDRIPFSRWSEPDSVVKLLQAGDRYRTVTAGVDSNPRCGGDGSFNAFILRKTR